MKNLVISFLFIGATLLYFGCDEGNPVAPDQNQIELETTSLEKWNRTPFTGTCTFVEDIDPGKTTVLQNGKTLIKGIKSVWYNDGSDPRVNGKSIWHFSMLLNEDGTGRSWGTAELIVDNNGGKWKKWFVGKITPEGGSAPTFGIGVKGDVKGLFAKWNYNILFSDGFYTIKGTIAGR